jgi:multifunctional beta-oxidation protein
MALVGFTKTLAFEGIKYNILANILAPVAASQMTETATSADKLATLKPECVVSIVAVLVHSSNTKETGSVFQVGAGQVFKLRWERSKGALMRPDDSLTPGVVLRNCNTILDFSRDSQYPTGVSNIVNNLEKALALPRSPNSEHVDFRGKVALITRAGGGLGRAYALAFAKVGAKVVVNDVKNSDTVAREIRSIGGDALGVNLSVEDGGGVVEACLNAYGRLDIVVNNAGILRDKSFTNMTDELWESVLTIHLRGTYKITKAAWPHMVRQRYGRIVNITSTTGVYGNFGQANYATAVSGLSPQLSLKEAE